jgi:hypothetical protein
MLRFLVESPLFAGKRKCEIPAVRSADEAAREIIAALNLADELQPEAALIEIYDAAWSEYVHLENIAELKDKSKVRVSVVELGDGTEDSQKATSENMETETAAVGEIEEEEPAEENLASLQARMTAYYDLEQEQSQDDLTAELTAENKPTKDTESSVFFREQLLAIYAEKNPEKVGDVEGLVEKYGGKEVEALQLVRQKYGYSDAASAAASATASAHENGQSISALPTPAVKLEYAPAVPSARHVQPNLPVAHAAPIMRSPEAKARDVSESFRTQLRVIYATKCPEKMGDVEVLVEKYRGREVDALQIVREKYLGIAPKPPGPAEKRAVARARRAERLRLRAEIVAIYKLYNPAKIGAELDALLHKYRGREEQVLSIVREKYLIPRAPKVGARVRLVGLTKAAHFNDQLAGVASVVGDRLLVTLEGTGKQLKVKPENVRHAGGSSLDDVLVGRPGGRPDLNSLDIITDGLDSQFNSIFASVSPTNSVHSSGHGSSVNSPASNSSPRKQASHFTFDGAGHGAGEPPSASKAVEVFDEIFGQPTPVKGGRANEVYGPGGDLAWKVCIYRRAI